MPENVHTEVAIKAVGVEVKLVDANAGVAYELYNKMAVSTSIQIDRAKVGMKGRR